MKKFFLTMFLAAGLLTTQAQKTSAKPQTLQSSEFLSESGIEVTQTASSLYIRLKYGSNTRQVWIQNEIETIVWSKTFNPGDAKTVDTSSLPSGLYRVKSDDGEEVIITIP